MTEHWRITSDPLGLFAAEEEIASREGAAREQGEDLLQLEVRRPGGRVIVVDLGWYRDRYVVVEVEEHAWDVPFLKLEFRNLAEAVTQVRSLVQ